MAKSGVGGGVADTHKAKQKIKKKCIRVGLNLRLAMVIALLNPSYALDAVIHVANWTL